MKRVLVCLWITAPMAAPQGTEAPAPAAVASAVSQSGQFTVIGGTAASRRDFAARCDTLSRDVAAVTGRPGGSWTQPYVVQLTVADQPQIVRQRATPRVFPLEPNGFRFQLDLLLDGELHLEEFEGALVELLLQERMLDPRRNEPPSSVIPDWIRSGVQELVAYRRAGRPSEVFGALIDARQIPPVREVLEADGEAFPDSVSRSIHRACSAALIQALLEQGGGPARFQALLEDLAYSRKPVTTLFQAHFPALDQAPEALSKWWALQLAAMSEKSAFDFLPPAETDRLLEQLLLIDLTVITEEALAAAAEEAARDRRFWMPELPKLPTFRPKGETAFTTGSVREFDRFLTDRRAPLALRQCQNRLRHLSARAFPLHRPVIERYEVLLTRLAQRDAKNAAAEFKEIDRLRAGILGEMSAVTDYMNWFVTTQVREETDEFTGYATALRDLRNLETRRRQDPVTRYLDAMERELGSPP